MTHDMLWLDFETTGANPMRDRPIEVAAIVTDDRLVELGRMESLIRPTWLSWQKMMRTPELLAMHRRSGLIDALQDRRVWPVLPGLAETETKLLALVDRYCEPDDQLVLAGSGVGHFDLPLIRARMPRLAQRLTYWVHDVGVLRRTYHRVHGHRLTSIDKDKPHRAMADIETHLAEGKLFDEFIAAGAPHALSA